MLGALKSLAKGLAASRAGVGLIARVGGHVDAEAVLPKEALAALEANVGPLPSMLLYVALKIIFHQEAVVAVGALIRQVAVGPHVPVPIPLHCKHLVTDTALVWNSGLVFGHVDLQALLVEVEIATL